MRKVIIIYDDSARPGADIRSITGGKSFGNTIFKRVTLAEHTARLFGDFEEVIGYTTLLNAKAYLATFISKDIVPVVMKSQFIVTDISAVKVIIEKACYAHENYKVVMDDKIACVIYGTPEGFFDAKDKDVTAFAPITTEAFIDISDVDHFRQFITGGFEARFFNALSGDEYTVIKKSENIEKLRAEYTFYSLLPDDMKQWFVQPFDFSEDGRAAQYKMERFHMADLAIRYVHGAIALDEFEDILGKLFHFVSHRHNKTVSADEYEKKAEELYIKKVDDRIAALKSMPEYESISKLIADTTEFSSIDDIVAKYKSLYESIRAGRRFKNELAVGHGDLCFSNILYSKDASLLKLIDPKGAIVEDEIYTDPYYDLAKLSHSICGYYDYFNSDLFQITVDEGLKSHLSMDFDNSEYVAVFRKKLEENGMDLKLIRLYECSLFLSMLPLHIDRPKKVYAFILNAIAILNSLEDAK